MAEHLVICELVGTGFASDPDPVYGEKSFKPSIPDSFRIPVRRASVPDTVDLEQGYYAAWIECDAATLATLIAQGHVRTVIYSEPEVP